MTRVRRSIGRIAHVGALVFCAWWLIATSAVNEPPRECFTGLGETARIQVLLGAARQAPDSGGSCAGVDGLTAGSTLVLDLVREEANIGCIGYEIRSISAGTGVAAEPRIPEPRGSKFASIHADFRSTSRTDCFGTWFLILNPATLPPAEQVVSPLDAGPSQPWIVDRFMFLRLSDGTAACGLPATSAWATCGDRFAVEGITEVAGP